MNFTVSVLSTVLLFYGVSFGQAAAAVKVRTFHVRGTITDPIEAVIPGVKVTFQSQEMSKVVMTDRVGAYEADLPLGEYTMSAASRGFRRYRRPTFRVSSSREITINVVLPVGKIIDIVEIPAAIEAQKAAPTEGRPFDLPYYGEESFTLPSDAGVPFELYVRYETGARVGDIHNYEGEKTRDGDPVFVAYDLFSMRADHVAYNVREHTLKMRGNVVTIDESGVASAPEQSVTFEIKDGLVTRRP